MMPRFSLFMGAVTGEKGVSRGSLRHLKRLSVPLASRPSAFGKRRLFVGVGTSDPGVVWSAFDRRRSGMLFFGVRFTRAANSKSARNYTGLDRCKYGPQTQTTSRQCQAC